MAALFIQSEVDLMRKFIAIILVLFCTLGLIVNDAQAKRFGGGRSFGMTRSASSFTKPGASSFAQPAGATGNRWLGPLAGLAIGGLLTSMFMGHGFGTGMLTWIALGGLVLLVVNFLRQRNAQSAPFTQQQPNRDTSAYFSGNTFNQTASSSSHPARFDQTAFLRDAKVQFIRLQSAYDQKNLNDLRQFTTPQVFGEIQLQLHERGEASNVTEVVSLDVELLDAVEEGRDLVASVRFTGMIKEEVNAPATALNEVWHFRQDSPSSSWIVAGVQQ
jgi:predicted lipid-binding transport protein (Tim44 family)